MCANFVLPLITTSFLAFSTTFVWVAGKMLAKALRGALGMGLTKWSDDDARWRHVGRCEGNIILFDLADLEKVPPGAAKEEVVQNHV